MTLPAPSFVPARAPVAARPSSLYRHEVRHAAIDAVLEAVAAVADGRARRSTAATRTSPAAGAR